MILKSTSSGKWGWSRLSSYLYCSALAAENHNRTGERKLYEEIEKKPVATLVGSIFGEMSQRYVNENAVMPNEELIWEYESGETVNLDVSHPNTVAEARRLYIAYTKNYRPDHLGRIVACEFPITIPGSIFGVEFDISGNIDLVVETAKGIEIWDIKTEGREESNLSAKFSLRHQKWLYALGYEVATGVQPVGTGIDCTIKTKEPKFKKFEYEGLTDKRFAWLQAAVKKVEHGMKNPSPEPKLENCWPYGQCCVYLQDGMCSI